MWVMIGMLLGFAGGVCYSRRKADPVQAALFDTRRLLRAASRGLVAIGRSLALALAGVFRRMRRHRARRQTTCDL